MALAPAALLRLEAAYGVLQNDEIETSFAEVSKSFAAIDKKERSKFTLADWWPQILVVLVCSEPLGWEVFIWPNTNGPTKILNDWQICGPKIANWWDDFRVEDMIPRHPVIKLCPMSSLEAQQESNKCFAKPIDAAGKWHLATQWRDQAYDVAAENRHFVTI